MTEKFKKLKKKKRKDTFTQFLNFLKSKDENCEQWVIYQDKKSTFIDIKQNTILIRSQHKGRPAQLTQVNNAKDKSKIKKNLP